MLAPRLRFTLLVDGQPVAIDSQAMMTYDTFQYVLMEIPLSPQQLRSVVRRASDSERPLHIANCALIIAFTGRSRSPWQTERSMCAGRDRGVRVQRFRVPLCAHRALRAVGVLMAPKPLATETQVPDMQFARFMDWYDGVGADSYAVHYYYDCLFYAHCRRDFEPRELLLRAVAFSGAPSGSVHIRALRQWHAVTTSDFGVFWITDQLLLQYKVLMRYRHRASWVSYVDPDEWFTTSRCPNDVRTFSADVRSQSLRRLLSNAAPSVQILYLDMWECVNGRTKFFVRPAAVGRHQETHWANLPTGAVMSQPPNRLETYWSSTLRFDTSSCDAAAARSRFHDTPSMDAEWGAELTRSNATFAVPTMDAIACTSHTAYLLHVDVSFDGLTNYAAAVNDDSASAGRTPLRALDFLHRNEPYLRCPVLQCGANVTYGPLSARGFRNGRINSERLHRLALDVPARAKRRT